MSIPEEPVGSFPGGCTFVYIRATDGMEKVSAPRVGNINGIQCELAIPFMLTEGQRIVVTFRGGQLWMKMEDRKKEETE